MRMLIIDGEPLVRDALAHLLAELLPGTCVLEAASLADGLQVLVREPAIGLVVLDPAEANPRADLGAVVDAIRQTRDDVAVFVLSARDDEATHRAALARGAVGFASKRASRAALGSSLAAALNGLGLMQTPASPPDRAG